MAFPLPIFRSPIVYDGTTGDDALYSRFSTAVNEFFYGYEGNDYIDGGLGADRMFGGAGHDTYVVENAGDQVFENANEGFDTVRVSFSYTIPLNVERVELTGTAAINATGSSADDRLYGNVSSNILWGHAGHDILNGREGTDTMIGGIGNDTYYVDNAGDVVVEYEGEGTDWVATTISYTLGHNLENLSFLVAGDMNGTGNELDNRLHGNGYANVLSGLDGNDSLYGENGEDQLFGGAGNDYLDGDFSNDILVGGIGADTMDGGTGADIFRFLTVADAPVGGAGFTDYIPDFTEAQGDKIDLSAIDANTILGGDQAFTPIGVNVAFNGIAGELRFNGGFLEGDVNGDAVADFQIELDVAVVSAAALVF